MKTCKTCCYWRNQRKPLLIAECDLVGRGDPRKNRAAFDIEIEVSDDSGLEFRLITGPDFGCIHHHEKA